VHHQFQVGETVHPVWLSRRGSGYLLHLGDTEIPVTLREDVRGLVLETGGDADRVVIATRGDEVYVHLDGAAYALRYRHPLDSVSHHGTGDTDDCVRAPMPGTAVVIHVETGRKVARGDALLVMESMKLETTIAAPREGIVQAVHVALGQTFERDAPLVTLETEEAPA
jgi:biotin carboxyl carrier protein